MYRVMLVEDDARLAELVTEYLSGYEFAVELVTRGDAALGRFKELAPDVVILDLMLPGLDGMVVCRQIRDQSDVPILILTARGNWQDKVEGLAAGADDYVVKPFQFEELEARLNALLRRSSGFTQSTIVAGGLVLDINRKQAVLDDKPLPLTAYEYRILEYLMRHHQQVVAKDRLMEQLYPDDEERDPNVIEVLVGRLRRKLEGANGFKPIDTVRGLGYLFTERCR